jgi:hypothetical protein
MPGFQYILHLTISIYLKGKAEPLLPHGAHMACEHEYMNMSPPPKYRACYGTAHGGLKGLKLFILPINNFFLLTGISITRTGISNKNPTGTGILPKFQVGNGIGTPTSGPSIKLHCDYKILHCDYKILHCDYKIWHCDYKILHCDYRKLHCDYRKLHCDYKILHCDYRKLHCDYRKLHCDYRKLHRDYRKLHCDYRKLHRDYRKLHCDYRKLHCDYRKLHCCLGLTALKSTKHSRVIFLCILLLLLHNKNMMKLCGNIIENYAIQKWKWDWNSHFRTLQKIAL